VRWVGEGEGDGGRGGPASARERFGGTPGAVPGWAVTVAAVTVTVTAAEAGSSPEKGVARVSHVHVPHVPHVPPSQPPQR
jgi:hypothetical protein